MESTENRMHIEMNLFQSIKLIWFGSIECIKHEKMMTIGISKAFTDAATLIAEQAIEGVVAQLAEKYGFDPEEAKAFLKGDISITKEVPAKHLPWCGVKNAEFCDGIEFNCGLYTQCGQKPAEGNWCKKCAKQVAQNGSPNNGDIDQRNACEGLYKIGKRTEIPYTKFMQRHGYTREGVEKAAAKLGLTVPAKHFEAYESKPGRPATTKMRMETPLEDLPEPPTEEETKAKKHKKKSKTPEPVEEPEKDAETPVETPATAVETPVESMPIESIPTGLEDELEEEEVSEEEYTAEDLEKMMVPDLRKLAESCGISTRENGKLISPKQLREVVRAHFQV
jgi:hypothetical protein